MLCEDRMKLILKNLTFSATFLHNHTIYRLYTALHLILSHITSYLSVIFIFHFEFRANHFFSTPAILDSRRRLVRADCYRSTSPEEQCRAPVSHNARSSYTMRARVVDHPAPTAPLRYTGRLAAHAIRRHASLPDFLAAPFVPVSKS